MVGFYDRKYLVRCLLTLLGVVAVMYEAGGIGFAVMIPVALMALGARRAEDLLFCLAVTGSLVVGNGNLIPKDLSFFVIQRGLLATLACVLSVRVFGRRLPVTLRPVLALLAYVAYMTVPSAFGWCPMVSFLKLFLFVVCLMAYLGVAASTIADSRGESARVRSIALALGVFYIGGSVLLIPFPQISQLSGEAFVEAVAAGRDITSLFTGMTNQSQCLGPVVAVLSCFLLGDLLFGIRRWNRLYVLLLVCSPFLIYKTSSRTAAGTYLVGQLTVLYFFLKARGVGARWRARVMNFALVVCIAGVACLVGSSAVRQGATGFILKSTGDVQAKDISFETVTSSRQGLMEEALYNFRKRPLFGNGFQVAERMEGAQINSFKEALSAPVEKGVWVTAVLEEGGVFGFLIFLAFVVGAVVKLSRAQAYVGCSVLVTFVVANLGEFMFFSMSYIGGFMWVMLFLGLTLDAIRLREMRSVSRGGGGAKSQTPLSCQSEMWYNAENHRETN